MLQDRSGHILVCTEQGVFAYDGRRFVNLGPSQGLREGGFVYGMALTAAGRVAVQYDREIRISNQATDATRSPSSLNFTPVLHPGISFNSSTPHQLAPWQEGLAVLGGGTTVRVVVPAQGPPHVETMGYDPAEEAVLHGASAIFSVHDHIWEAFSSGRLCAADPGDVRCYSAFDGLTGGQVFDVIAGPGKAVIARSASSVATFDPKSGRWATVTLPDQGERYINFLLNVGLFRDPDGQLVTQAAHGLDVLRDGVWKEMTVADGAPAGTIVSAMTDATGQFWLQALGLGLIRWIGYGHWEAIDKTNGLPDGFAWQTARLPDGSMWVTTDSGVVEVVRHDDGLQVGRTIAGSSYSLGVGPRGRLWSSFSIHGLRITDPADGSSTKISVPDVNAILPDPAGYVWLGTEGGLFRVDDRAGIPPQALEEGPPKAQVTDIVSDGSGGIYYLASGRLRHRHPDGQDTFIMVPWPSDSFDPITMAVEKNGSLWIGGPSGLIRVRLTGDLVSSVASTSVSDTQSSTIYAVMIDHRGWVWTGTATGISVFNGAHWVSVDADSGLLASDVNERGLREDPDGSVWIVTSHGLSHLLDPTWLFADQPVKVVISDARLGQNVITGRRMPYSTQGLSLQFGTPAYGAEQSIVFRYRLSGVDADWVKTSTGNVRYAFVPPGRHLLTVVGFDRLTHRTSDPCSLLVDISYPWWRQWWAQTLWTLGAMLFTLGTVYGITRFRLRSVLARQTELKRHVVEATAKLQARTEELHHQAVHDSLTGLLNRSEIERRLASALTHGRAGDELILALLDVDHFKRINDRYGHLSGDDVLRAMGRLVTDVIGKGEFAGRYGGEEILLVLQDANGNGAKRILDLHRTIQVEAIKSAGMVISVTCSIGLTWAVRGDNWESLVGRADEALYRAKASGRNCVIENPRILSNKAGNTSGDSTGGPGS